MKDSALVTVVMAVYNAEKSLEQSISSVISQTLSRWKLICVNDGSTDLSLQILEDYAKNDDRILIVSKENGGPASARALAFSMVESPYAIILDADDRLTSNLLEDCVNKAIKYDADAIAPNFLIELSNGSYMDWNKSYKWGESDCISGIDAFKRTLITPTMHGVNLWRTSLLKKFAVGDNANYNNFNEDEYIQRILFLNCNRIYFSTNCAYIYSNNVDSITKKFSLKQLQYVKTCEKLQNLNVEYNLDDEIVALINEYYFRIIIQLNIRIYKNRRNLSRSEYREALNFIKSKYNNIIKLKKDFHFIDKNNPWLYRLFSTNGYFLFNLTTRIFAAI